MLSIFLTVVCSDQMVWNSFRRCFLYYVCPPSSLSKSKVGKCPAQVNLLCEWISKLSDAIRHVHHIHTYLFGSVNSNVREVVLPLFFFSISLPKHLA